MATAWQPVAVISVVFLGFFMEVIRSSILRDRSPREGGRRQMHIAIICRFVKRANRP
jgi:hypothetical protein